MEHASGMGCVTLKTSLECRKCWKMLEKAQNQPFPAFSAFSALQRRFQRDATHTAGMFHRNAPRREPGAVLYGTGREYRALRLNYESQKALFQVP